MSASLNVIAAENAEGIPLCQPKTFGDTRPLDADKIPHMQTTLQDRLEKLIADKGLSIAEAERRSGLSKDTLRKLIKNRQQSPSTRTLAAIANTFGVSHHWLITGEEDTLGTGALVMTDHAPADVRPALVPGPNVFELPRDVEVRGTAAGSHFRGAFQFSGETIEWVRRPPALIGARDVYALYVEGSSMEPQYRPGELIYVHPNRPARFGDAVVVQTCVGDNEIEATIGVYIKLTEKWVFLKKHNPAAEIRIPRNAATRIHKILTTNELFGV